MRFLRPRTLAYLAARDLPWLGRAWRALVRGNAATPQSAAEWEREYAGGRWDYLGGLDEAGRHGVVAAYYARFRGEGAALEVGCGEGVTQRLLHAMGCRDYLGIDAAPSAIARAQAAPGAEFLVADAETFATERRFDAILLIESAYYLADPPAQLRRYAGFLKPGGVLIVSMFVYGLRVLDLWERFGRDFATVDETTVINARGHASTVKVLRPGAP